MIGRDYENEFEALNVSSKWFYNMMTYDFLDGQKMEYLEREKDPDDPYEIDGILVDHVNFESRDHQSFAELMAELTKL